MGDNAGKTLDIEQNAREDEVDKYPLLIRLFGVVSIIGGGLQVVAFALELVALFTGQVDFTTIEEHTATTIVIAGVESVLMVVLAAMFVVLGIRLVRGRRYIAALLCNIMIALEILVLVCQFMLTGLSTELIAPGVNMIILIALQSYSDPALRDERKLQRKLLALDRKAEAEDGTLGRDTSGKGYITLNFFNIFWVFVICCVLGLIIEVIWHMVVVDPGHYQDRAGLLYGPFSPIYGVGAVLMTVALNRFHDKNPVLIFVIAGVIGGAFEFFVSWFMEVAFGIVAWDYSGTFLNIDGRTNFMFMCMWGVLGLVWVKFALPIMLKIVNMIPWNWRYAVTTVCTVLMAIDCVLTLASFDCWFQREAGTMDYNDPSAIVQFCNENYGNDYMANRFQSMTIDPNNASRVS
ncbi:MAG: hypothetical protein E7Z99_06785 [Coriobacteriaceae bacterium]|nr:hypothetical protein [Coriobacteriaceae bacterium]